MISAMKDLRAAPANDVSTASAGLTVYGDARGLRQSDPLFAAPLKALYDATDLLHGLGRSHCRAARCPLCHDVRMCLAVIDPTLGSLEGAYSFATDADLSRRRDESRAAQADKRHRSPRPWRPRCGDNHPLHELTILTLADAGLALGKLHRSRACGPDVGADAEVGSYVIPLLVAQLESTVVPTPAFLQLRFPGRNNARLLRILDHEGPSSVGTGE